MTRPRLFLALAPRSEGAALGQAAREAGLDFEHATDLPTLLASLERRAAAATLLSLSVPPIDEAVARRIGGEASAGALLISAPSVSLERALLAEDAGAAALLREPIESSELAIALGDLAREGPEVALPEPPPGDDAGVELVGESPAMAHVFNTIARVAPSTSTVLLTGESGTGKEVVARALHAASDRSAGPFVAVNCAAIPESLLETELFGHEKGAFTGAVARRRGRFERAHGGTLFLDEIGDMSLLLQAKLLRALEERTVEAVGGERPMPVDVRCIAATNQDLTSAIAAKTFRRDLYFRLAVVELTLPALRERHGDVRRLALHYAVRFAGLHGRTMRAITERALARLDGYDWPGNVRELRNVMDRAVLLSSGDVVRSSSLRLGSSAPHAAPRASQPARSGRLVMATLAEVEADHIASVVRLVGGRMTEAARVLGIHRNTLARKVREHRIDIGTTALGET
jgi:two-component system response regulator AtoC